MSTLDQFTTKIKGREITFALIKRGVNDFRLSRKVGETSSVMQTFTDETHAREHFAAMRDSLSKGQVIATITLQAFQGDNLEQAVAAIFQPRIKIHKPETDALITDLCQKISQSMTEILDFDNG